MEDPLRVEACLVAFTVGAEGLQALLCRRAALPSQGCWSLPGSFLRPDEGLEAAARVLAEGAGIPEAYLEQLYTFGQPGRDPRGRVVTVSYLALAREQDRPGRIVGDGQAAWFDALDPPRMAFDHGAILQTAVARLRSKLGYTNIVVNLLPPEFTLSELQRTYEHILGRALDKRNFRKKMLALGLLEPTGGTVMHGVHRPARLYRFREQQVVFAPIL